MRFGCPLYATAEVLAQAAYQLDDRSRDKKGSCSKYTLEELEGILRKIIKKEDCESAARARDAIERRRRLEWGRGPPNKLAAQLLCC